MAEDKVTIGEDPKEYRKKIYTLLSDNFSDFKTTEVDFYSKLDKDPEYAGKVWNVISNNISDFKRPKEEFISLIGPGPKKKDLFGGAITYAGQLAKGVGEVVGKVGRGLETVARASLEQQRKGGEKVLQPTGKVVEPEMPKESFFDSLTYQQDIKDPIGNLRRSLIKPSVPLLGQEMPSSTYVRMPESQILKQSDKFSEKRIDNIQKENAINQLKLILSSDSDEAVNQLSRTTGIPAQNLKSLSKNQLRSLDVSDNETNKIAVNSLLNAIDVRQAITNAKSISQAALNYELNRDPEKAKRYAQGVQFSPKVMGKMVFDFMNNPSVDFELKNTNPGLYQEYARISENFLENYPEYGAVVVGNKVSRGYEKQKDWYENVGIHADFIKDDLDDYAKSSLSPKEYGIYSKYIKGNEENYIDTPSLLEGIASGGKAVFKGFYRSVSEPFVGAKESDIRKWEEEASNVSADPEGMSKWLRESGHVVGLVAALMGTGGVLRGAGMTPKYANALNIGTAFFGDQLKLAKEKFPDSPIKYTTDALINTALFVALGQHIFPTDKIAQAVRGVRPEIGKVVENLASGSVTREAARQQMNTIYKKAFDVLSAGLKQNVKISTELTGIAALNRGLDEVFGMDERKYEQYHPKDEVAQTFKAMFLSNAMVSGLAGYGAVRNRNRIAAESYYEAASNPERFKKIIDFASELNPEMNREELLSNLNFISEVKRTLDARDMSPENQKRYLASAIKAKVLQDAAKAERDDVIRRQKQEEIDELTREREDIISGVAPETRVREEEVVSPPVEAEGEVTMPVVVPEDVSREVARSREAAAEGVTREVPSTEGVMPVVVPEDVSREVARSREVAPEVPQPQEKPAILEIEQAETIRQMLPITDKMVNIERQFENEGYKIDTDYDNEIIITDKAGEIVDPADIPKRLSDLASEYEIATSKLGEFDDVAREKALSQSRGFEEVVGEVVPEVPSMGLAPSIIEVKSPKEVKQGDTVVWRGEDFTVEEVNSKGGFNLRNVKDRTNTVTDARITDAEFQGKRGEVPTEAAPEIPEQTIQQQKDSISRAVKESGYDVTPEQLDAIYDALTEGGGKISEDKVRRILKSGFIGANRVATAINDLGVKPGELAPEVPESKLKPQEEKPILEPQKPVYGKEKPAEAVGEVKINSEKVQYNGTDAIGSRERAESDKIAARNEAKEKIKNPETNASLKAANSYNESVGLPKVTSHAYKPSDKALQSEVAKVYPKLQDVNSPTYQETQLERNIYEAYKKQFPDIIAKYNIKDYKDLVKKAYAQLIQEVELQYKSLPVKVTFHEKGEGNYENSAEMLDDVHNFNHLWVYKGGEDHTELGSKTTDKDGLTANDKFRAVHDYFGHSIEGYEFGKNGEENAWIEHSKMFSPLAQWALSSETRGQNSFVNYSGINDAVLETIKTASALKKEGMRLGNQEMIDEANKLLSTVYDDFQFAEQKAIILPPKYTDYSKYHTTKISETPKKLEDAIQKQAAGEVPVQPEARAGEEMAAGVPGAKPREVTEEGKVEGQEGEVTPPVPPAEAPRVELPKGGEEREKAFLNAILGARGTPEAAKEGMRREGLTYKTSSQTEARELANSIVEELGVDEAVDMARKQELYDGDVNAFIMGRALEKLADLESASTSPQEKQKYAERFKEIAIAQDKMARYGGRFNSAIGDFYKKSPLGVVLYENAKRQENFTDWSRNKEESWKDFYARLMEEPEFAEVVGKEVSEKVKAERAQERAAKKEKAYKAIDNGIAKVKDLIKKNLTAELPEGTKKMGVSIDVDKILDAAGEVMKKAYDAGETVKEAVQKAIDYISAQVGNDKWGVDEFRKSAEESLGSVEGKGKKYSEEAYRERLKKQIKDIDEQLAEMKRKPKAEKEEKEYQEETKKLIEERNEKKKQLDEAIPVTREISPESILKRIRKKLNGLNEKEKKEVVRNSFNKIIESGGLNFQDFRDIIARVTGRGQMTPEQAAKIKELVDKTNSVEAAAQRARDLRTPQAFKEYKIVQLEAAKAAAELKDMLDTDVNISDRINSLIQLNTLGAVTLALNPLLNIVNQIGVRFPAAVQSRFIDAGLSAAAKAVGMKYEADPSVLSLQAQKEYFKNLGVGFKEAGEQLWTGLNRQDYTQKEITTQKIRPLESWKALFNIARRKRKASTKEVIDKTLQALPGVPAEIVARSLNLGDKPFRFGTEAAWGSAFAKKLGLTDIDYTLFLEFPREEAYRNYKKQGLSDKEAAEKADYVKDLIVKEGKKATFTQDNILNDLTSALFENKAFKGTGNIVKTFVLSPYIKVPANAYWSYYNIVNPEVAMLQAMYYGGKAAKQSGNAKKMSLRDARYWFGHATVGIATRAVIWSLVQAGIAIPGSDKEETKKEREGKRQFVQPGTINIDKLRAFVNGENPDDVKGGLEIPFKYWGHFGQVANSIGKQYQDMTPEQRNAKRDFWNDAYGGLKLEALKELENGIFSNASSLLSGLSGEGTFDLRRFGMNTLNLLTNVVHPATMAQISRAELPYQSTTRADNFLQEIKNNTLQRSSVFRKLAGEMPPSKVGIWGDVLTKEGGTVQKVLGVSRANDDAFAAPVWELYSKTGDIGYFPPVILPVLRDNKLNTEQLTKLQQYAGAARKERIAPIVNDEVDIMGFGVKFSELSDEDKKMVLNYEYELGKRIGEGKLYKEFPELAPKEKEVDMLNNIQRKLFIRLEKYR